MAPRTSPINVNGEVTDARKNVGSARTPSLDDALSAALSALRTRQPEERIAAGSAYDRRSGC
jgi:hypothetical protein